MPPSPREKRCNRSGLVGRFPTPPVEFVRTAARWSLQVWLPLPATDCGAAADASTLPREIRQERGKALPQEAGFGHAAAMMHRSLYAAVAVLVMGLAAGAQSAPAVQLVRVPDGGIQPQVAVEPDGTVDVVYFRGDPARGDLYFVRSRDGVHFSAPIQVNHQPGDALAVGNVRGAHLAVGARGEVYVAWVGSDRARPRGPKSAPPMLFTRLNAQHTAFLPERNLVQHAWVLDGGAVAADPHGHVYVFWHAPGPGGEGEAFRRVWMARSADGGRHFQPEVAVSPQADGVCGCCGMDALASGDGTVRVVYRTAREMVHRDEFLLTSHDAGRHFTAQNLGPWKVGYCVMSTADLEPARRGILAAWEQEKQVHGAVLAKGQQEIEWTPAGNPGNRAHPVVAQGNGGEVLLAWTEGMGWERGGSLKWQTFDRAGHPVGPAGDASGVPKWSLISAWARPHGGFVVMY